MMYILEVNTWVISVLISNMSWITTGLIYQRLYTVFYSLMITTRVRLSLRISINSKMLYEFKIGAMRSRAIIIQV